MLMGIWISGVEYLSCNSGIVRTRILELTECAWAGPGPTLDESGKSLARFYWLQLHCVSGPWSLTINKGAKNVIKLLQPNQNGQRRAIWI